MCFCANKKALQRAYGQLEIQKMDLQQECQRVVACMRELKQHLADVEHSLHRAEENVTIKKNSAFSSVGDIK